MACCPSSGPPSPVQPGAAVLSADDTRHSQVLQVEWNEKLSLGRLAHKNLEGGDLALGHVTSFETHRVFKCKTIIRICRNFDVSEESLRQFLTNEADFGEDS